MTDYEINVPGGILSSLLSEKNGLATLVEAVLNQVLDAQANEQVGGIKILLQILKLRGCVPALKHFPA